MTDAKKTDDQTAPVTDVSTEANKPADPANAPPLQYTDDDLKAAVGWVRSSGRPDLADMLADALGLNKPAKPAPTSKK